MSVFKDKRVFGIKKNNASGISTAGQVSANDIILWCIFLMPGGIALFGAGQAFVVISLFIGTAFGWLFLSKRMNSYADISPKKIHNMSEFFEARYDSSFLKIFTLVIWIVALMLILVGVLNTLTGIISDYLGMSKNLTMITCLFLMILATIFFDNTTIGILKTIIFVVVIIISAITIVYIFMKHTPTELLDTYRNSNMVGDTSKYLNLLYYNGSYITFKEMLSFLCVGIGCVGMPLMYKGVINIKDVKQLDSGRIWAVTFVGLTIILTSVVDLLMAPIIYPDNISLEANAFENYNLFYKCLFKNESYDYVFKMLVLIIYMLAVIVLMESLMRNISEHIRGLVPTIKKVNSVWIKLTIDIFAVLFVAVVLFIVANQITIPSNNLIRYGWGICTAVTAAPCIVSLMVKKSTKAGILSGILVGLVSYTVWEFVPIMNGKTIVDAVNINSELIGFTSNLLFIFIVSAFSKKTRYDEQKVFDQMRMNQR